MFEDSKPIPSEVWIIMMVSHVHGLQHLLMYSRVGEPLSSIIPLRLVKGGNFICMCKVKGYRMTWAHVQDRNLHSFVEVKSPLNMFKFWYQLLKIFLVLYTHLHVKVMVSPF